MYLYLMQKIFLISITILSSLLSRTQVAVRNEPRHHDVFENDYIRVLDVFIPPHDTTLFHLHNAPSVFTTFTKTATGSELIGKQPVKDISIAGYSWYDSLATPRIHRVWNDDSTWFHVMDIEFTSKNPRSDQLVLQDPAMQLFFNQPQANGYHIKLGPKAHLQLPESGTGYFLLSTGEAVVEYRTNKFAQHRIMKSGHYIWIEPGSLFSITSTGDSAANFLLLQLK